MRVLVDFPHWSAAEAVTAAPVPAATAAGPAGDGGVVAISWLGLGLSAALILVQGAVSFR